MITTCYFPDIDGIRHIAGAIWSEDAALHWTTLVLVA